MDWKKLVSKFGGKMTRGEVAVPAPAGSDINDTVHAISGEQQ